MVLVPIISQLRLIILATALYTETGALVGSLLLWVTGRYDPSMSAIRTIVACIIDCVPTLIATVNVSATMSNPTARNSPTVSNRQ